MIYRLLASSQIPYFKMRKAIVEFVGTFFLMLIIVIAGVMGKAGDLAGVAIGLGLMALIYGGGHVSRAHYNPAITLAFCIRGEISRHEVLPYLIAQFSSCILGALVGIYLLGPGPAAIEIANLEVFPALVAEFFFTLALAWIILQVAMAPGLAGNQVYGLAIGSIVLAAIYCVGDISLAVLNPAVAIGLVIAGKLALSQLWIPVVASLAGSVAAALLFRLTCCHDDKCS